MFASQRPLLSHSAMQAQGHWSFTQSYGTRTDWGPGSGGGGAAVAAPGGTRTARTAATTAAYRTRLIDGVGMVRVVGMRYIGPR